MTDFPLQGGCLCGGIRYEVTGGYEGCVHCHCRMCQRAAGAPVVTWLLVTGDNFHIVKGTLKFYKSSERAERGICGDCGTQIVCRYFKDIGKSIDVTAASLDNPEAIEPTAQIWTSSRLAWMHGFDATLPGREGN